MHIELVALSATEAHPSATLGQQRQRAYKAPASPTTGSSSPSCDAPDEPRPTFTPIEAPTQDNAAKMLTSRSLIPMLVAGMLVTGIGNSLLNKYQDMQCVANCDSPDPKQHQEFSQPVWQTLQMFLGECLCLLPVLFRTLYNRFSGNDARDAALKKPLLQAPPDSGIIFDGDSSPRNRGGDAVSSYEATRGRVHTGATHAPTNPSTPAPPPEIAGRAVQPGELNESGFTDFNDSSYINAVESDEVGAFKGEALSGALVLWVGVFSVAFLRRHLHLFQWLSLVTVMMGVSVVGLSGTVFKSPEATGALDGDEDDELTESAQALLGVFLILFAQLFTASQFVLEEKIMSRYSVEPLLAVGYEGVFGSITTLIAMPLLHYFIGSTEEGRGGYFDMSAGFYQIMTVPAVLISSIAISFTIAFFNFFGLSVTRNVSATARSTIDTCRTLGIWIVSLTLGWETFRLQSGSLQVLGFVLLVYGTFLFNGIVRPPRWCDPYRSRGRYSRVAADETDDERA
ncbi:hypothetical protein PHBOTO_000169 [Pseudozyma hubeiensis]|nr:hypothetical protein PHBOTO_000169 [Pseudozyma hubeiensis]